MATEKKSTVKQKNPWVELLNDIWHNKLTVAVCIVVSAIIGVFAALWMRPVYEANALMQVKTKSGGSLSAILGDVSALLGMGGSSSDVEIQLMQSRRIMEEVVDSLGLQNVAEPIGFMDRLLHREGRADVRFLQFPDESVIPEDRVGESWYLVAEDSTTYSLYDDLEKKVLTGVVGELAVAPYNGDSAKILVSLMDACPGQKFRVYQELMIRAIKAVTSKFSISEKGKKTGVLSISYQDIYLDRAISVIDTLTSVYLRLNEEFGSSDMKNTLTLLESQLPTARRTLDSLMDTLNAYREKVGSADIETETKITLESRLRLQQKIIELEQVREEKARLFDASHPFIVTTDKQIAALKKELAKGDYQTKKLPVSQQKILTMTEEAKFAQNIYADLLKRVEQMRLLVAGASESAQIIDPPEADPKPVKPKKKIVLLAFIFVGFCFAIVIISIRKKMKGVTDPYEVSKQTGVNVYACIAKGEEEAKAGLESLQLSMALGSTGSSHVYCFAGLLPQVGSSFVASRVAKLFAENGKKVLLIDADLQQGELDKTFGIHASTGLVDVLVGKTPLQAAVCETQIPGLSVLPCGRHLMHSESVFGSEKFADLVQTVRNSYDVVILDSDSLQKTMDASVIGRMSDEIFLVLEHARHSLESVQTVLSQLPKTLPTKVFVLNKCEVLAKSKK